MTVLLIYLNSIIQIISILNNPLTSPLNFLYILMDPHFMVYKTDIILPVLIHTDFPDAMISLFVLGQVNFSQRAIDQALSKHFFQIRDNLNISIGGQLLNLLIKTKDKFLTL